ncbi:Hpt domain-containing protein [Paraburkholderia sp. IW21]|uniref:Hpt domain-containing protein n=1 Tax=Paraburkholderia sp. IW21 TaxID=3242488 RepID=UPI003521AB10
MSYTIAANDRQTLTAKIHELACGDAAVEQHLIRLLIDTNRATLDALRDSFNASLWDNVSGEAHRLKGAMCLLDSSALITLLARLEAAAKTRKTALVRTVLSVVTDSLERLNAQLEDLLNTGTRH